MKLRITFFLGLCATLATALVAQEPGPAAAPTRSPEQLDELLGPIALYPDALVALILPAATFSSDVVLAQRYLVAGNDAALIDDQEWDNSVKSLARYPDVMRWMDENLAWTKQVGEAFVVQPDDVMQSIQRLRARARAVGSLTDTPQQVVVLDNSAIRIVPADPEVIYVPYYDPQIVYVERTTYYPDPFLTFGYGFRVGWWLSYDCDWHHRSIWVSDRRRDWVGYREWRHPIFPGNPGYVSRPDRHPWTPPSNYRRFDRDGGNRARVDVVVRPTPNRDPGGRGSDSRNDSQRQTSAQRPTDRTREPSNSTGTSNSNSNRITVPQARENWRPTNNRARNENPSAPRSNTNEAAQPTTTVTTAPAASATPAAPAPSNRITTGGRDRQTRGDRGSYSRTSGDGSSPTPAPRQTTNVTAPSQPQLTTPATPPPAPAAIVRGNPSSNREYNGNGNNSNRGREVRSAPAPVSQPAPTAAPPQQRQTYSPRANYSQPSSQQQHRASSAPQPAYVPPQPAAAPAPATTYVAPAQAAPAPQQPQQQPAPPPQQREQRRDGHRQRGGD